MLQSMVVIAIPPYLISKAFQKFEQCIGRVVSSFWYVGRLDCGQSPLFHRQIGLGVAMGGCRAFMSKPKSDQSNVDTGLQEMHGNGVTHGVRRYVARQELGA